MNENIEIIRPEIQKKREKKQKRPFKLWEKILIFTSLIFIVGCMIFYGVRLVKYYKIYNPKMDGEVRELIMNSVVKNTPIVYENDGLYRASGMYIYKGENVNNYIKYSNMLFRIIKFNSDGSLDVVLNDGINMLKWDNEAKLFTDSDIYKYLNNYFYKLIDDSFLMPTSICNDRVLDLSNITCTERKMDSYVRLISVSEYLNSKVETSYLDGGNVWLSNNNGEKVWNINDSSLSLSPADDMYYVKPVLTLKNTTTLLSGSGTKEDPYIVSKNDELSIGKYVKLKDDIWVVYDKSNDIYKLSLNGMLETRNFGLDSSIYNLEDENSIAYYLNNNYYDSLSYKDKLLDADWYSGKYESYIDIGKSSVISKVGLLNISDLKFNKLHDYYLMTPASENKVYLYSELAKDANVNLYKDIVPTIAINKLNIISGTGTEADPYVLEV